MIQVNMNRKTVKKARSIWVAFKLSVIFLLVVLLSIKPAFASPTSAFSEEATEKLFYVARERNDSYWRLHARAEEILKLIQERADINAVDEHGRTPLMHAADWSYLGDKSYGINRGHLVILRVLIENGADVNAADKDGKTPLIWAAAVSNNKALRTLLDYGADVAIKDKTGKRALDYAKSRRISLSRGCGTFAGNEREWKRREDAYLLLRKKTLSRLGWLRFNIQYNTSVLIFAAFMLPVVVMLRNTKKKRPPLAGPT